MKRILGLIALVLVLLAAACSDDATQVSCGEGEFVQVGDVRACVYRQSVVVENGFRCPSEFPNLLEAGGVGVCAPQNDLGDGILDQIEEVYRDRRPDEFQCMFDRNCQADETCVNGTCRSASSGNNGADAGMSDAGDADSGAGVDADAGDAGTESGDAGICTSDADCAAPEVCLDGRCIVLEMAPCSEDSDCDLAENCIDSQCVPAADCGGFGGFQCDSGFWCDFPDDGQRCGIADGLGHCRPVPENCPTVVDPVCGCDGETYDNACIAQRSGQDTSSEMACR